MGLNGEVSYYDSYGKKKKTHHVRWKESGFYLDVERRLIREILTQLDGFSVQSHNKKCMHNAPN